MNGLVIDRVISVKFSDVYVDEHSDWKKHVKEITAKISKICGACRLQRFLPSDTLSLPYYALI
jgi:hypothetical protein